MKILVDVNLAVRWANMLSDRGIEAVHWTALGAATARDSEIMEYSRQNGYAVFTNDLDFSALLALTRASGPSVIQIRAEDTRPEALIDRVSGIFSKFHESIEQGSLITIDPQKARFRILPLIPPEEGDTGGR
jgi:predicted nuclease of predicted toxin-antitoxin system